MSSKEEVIEIKSAMQQIEQGKGVPHKEVKEKFNNKTPSQTWK
ncbi:hypothetical protein [Salicibibacter cibarius]|nr:hypothetical protein [Salicibibacter cibarius]